MKFFLTLSLSLAALSAPASAAQFDGTPTVSEEITLKQPPAKVWAAFGQFCSLTNWQDLVASCNLIQRPDGIYRVVVMTDNTAYVEHLVYLSDKDMAFGYAMKSGPVPVTHYRALFQVLPDKDGTSSDVRISAWYDVPKASSRAVADQALSKLFRNGLNGMAHYLTH